MSELSLTVSKLIDANIERVFDAWLDPVVLASFMLPKEEMPNPEVSIEPKVGGKYEIMMQVGDNKVPHHGEYRVIERPNRLVFSWLSPFAGDHSVVDIQFEAVSESETNVTLTHAQLPNEESQSGHKGGWEQILVSLSDQLV